MAVVAPSASSPGNLEPKPDQSSDTHTIEPKLDCPQKDNPNPSSLPPPVATITEHSNPNPNLVVITPPAPPVVPSFTPSFRPVLGAPQFSPVPNPSMQNPNLQPPGVAPQPTSVTVSPYPPPGVYYSAPGQLPGIAPRPYWQGPNGYMGVLPRASQGQGLMPPPGIPRYPAPYPMMVRPGFPPRAPVPIGVITSLGRPFVPGVSGALTIPSVVRPVVPIVAPAEKPQTTVYVGKIASTVENDFLLSLLRLCGPVKSWKRAQDPSDGTPRGFGFCEFESAEGVLRALRLLTKLNIDGQELVLNVNQATRTYLERYVEKKTERENLKETEGDVTNGESTSSVVQKQGSPKEELLKKDADDPEVKEKQDNHQEFGIVTEEDRDTDGDALEKIKNMLEERLKTRPLPPPPAAIPSDGPSKSNSELPSKPEEEINLDATRSSEDKNEDDETSEGKPRSGRDKFESLSDKSRIRERSRERDRDRDIKRDKEKELERYEWERERERARRERERDLKIREAERWYKDRVKEWEAREREKEYQRQYEREREKERESKRRRDILEQEDESDDEDTRKRRHRSSAFVEKKRKVQREKEEDHADRLREEEEIAEAKKRAAEEKKKKDHLKASVAADAATNGRNIEGAVEDKMDIDRQGVRPDDSRGIDVHAGDDAHIKGNIIESDMESISISETKQSNNTISKKLGFGLAASGKRTSVLSVFHEEEDEDVDKDKMGPLVPIDYSTEELQAVHIDISGTPPNLVAAAEFAKRISGDSKEDKTELERDRDRNRRNTERQRERERTDDGKYTKNESRERIREKNHERDREQEEKPRVTENKKLLDAKQLIDMIPKTKNELFSYEINWSIYDKHELHARMRPWISKKITEFLGEEEATFVDYIVSSTKDHVQASEMLQLLQPILDEEAEMFVLKMWRMLIFEIKKVETGISTKSRS